ncbi:ALP1-like protein [Tanacetum coccineum]
MYEYAVSTEMDYAVAVLIYFTEREGISPLLKCTSAIRQLAYGVVSGFLDEYLQMSERTSRLSLDYFCTSVMEIFGPEYFRKPTVTDVVKLYQHHEEKHEFSEMLGSLDCTDWEWFDCSYAYKAQYVRRDHGLDLFIFPEVVASQDLWIWHAFFGNAISPHWYPEEAHQLDDLLQFDEEMQKVMSHIRSSQAHQNLLSDLVEPLSRNDKS